MQTTPVPNPNKADGRPVYLLAIPVTANPEGQITAPPGQLAVNVNSGSAYAKLTGTGNTGWSTISGGGGGGATKFVQLTDVPNSYAGSANKAVAVNGSANALTFVDFPTAPTSYLNKQPNGAFFGGDQTFFGSAGTQAVDIQSARASVYTTAKGAQSVAIGYKVGADMASGVAIGNGASATSPYGIAIGSSAYAQSSYSVVLGKNARDSVLQPNGVVIGNGANASGSATVGIGANVSSAGDFCVAIGAHAQTTADFAVAVGPYSTAAGSRAVSIGRSASAVLRSIAVGPYATASGNYSVALGDYSTSVSEYAVSIGSHSSSTGSKNVALGAYATAAGGYASMMALGSNAYAFGDSATAVGSHSSASGYRSVALGCYAVSSGYETVAVGANAGTGTDFTVNFGGPIINRKDNSQSNPFASFSGAEVILVSSIVDFTQTGTVTVTISGGAHFYPHEVGVSIFSASGVLVQPHVSFGNSGSTTALLVSTTTTGLTANWAAQRFQTLLTSAGQVSVTGTVATASTATALQGRFYFKGLLVEDN